MLGGVLGLGIGNLLARAMRAGVGDVLKSRSRSVVGGSLSLPRFLVSAQIALCLVALTSAGLLARSLDNFAALDLGIDTESLSYATVNPSVAGYTPELIGPYLDTARNQLEALPGVDSVGVLNRRVLDGAVNISPILLADEPQERSGEFDVFDMSNAAHTVSAGAGAFETLGIEIIRGRALNARDGGNAVVDERFFEHFLDGRPPIGRRIALGQEAEYTIVGVARNVPWGRLREADFPVVYTGAEANGPASFGGRIHFAIHSSVNPADLAAQVRSVLAGVVRMMLRDSFAMVVAGIVVGLPCAYGIARVLESALFELEPTDLPSLVLSLLALSLVAFGATWLPARRAANIDPMNALREQ